VQISLSPTAGGGALTGSGCVVRTAVGDVEFAIDAGDAPVVLASHAGLGGFDQARLILDWLDPREYRRLAVSRPGYLRTPLESGRSPVEQADMFAALLDRLDIRRVAVVTLSAGGPAGYLFAARHPERVAALVCIDSVSGRHELPETAGPIAQAMFMSDWGQALMRAVIRRKPSWVVRELLRGTAHFSKPQLDRHVAHVLASSDALAFIGSFVETMAPYRPRVAGSENDAEQLRQLARLPLESVRAPVLIVHGTHDADVKFHHGVYAFEHISAAERYWIDEGDHLGFWLSPESRSAQDTARAFLRRHAP
jgi:pimeloyl-ACP methyl ester carboxylesterase